LEDEGVKCALLNSKETKKLGETYLSKRGLSMERVTNCTDVADCKEYWIIPV
jgi:hypothetical protein